MVLSSSGHACSAQSPASCGQALYTCLGRAAAETWSCCIKDWKAYSARQLLTERNPVETHSSASALDI